MSRAHVEGLDLRPDLSRVVADEIKGCDLTRRLVGC